MSTNKQKTNFMNQPKFSVSFMLQKMKVEIKKIQDKKTKMPFEIITKGVIKCSKTTKQNFPLSIS